MTNISEDKVAIALGTDDEDKQLGILRTMAAPPIVITIVATGLGGISISGVGNAKFCGGTKHLLGRAQAGCRPRVCTREIPLKCPNLSVPIVTR
jgi:hypothetical protein